MKFNKLKILSIAICCAVTALWSEAQGMERERRNDEPIRHHQAEIFPTGSVIAFAGEIAPHGWLLCDGKDYSNQEYHELYEVIQMKYVPSGSWIIEANNRSKIEKHFCVPDLRGRVIVGVDNGGIRVTSNNTLGASSGEERHKLTVDELAAHTHTVRDYGGGPKPAVDGLLDKNSSISPIPQTSSISGGDQPHNNMQPYQVLNYIINTGEMNKQEKLNIEIERLKNELAEVKQRRIVVAAGRFLQTTSGNIDISQCFGVRSITYADNSGYMQFTINYNSNLVNPPIIVATSGITINLNGGAVGIVSSTNTSSTIVQLDARGAATTYINFHAISMG